MKNLGSKDASSTMSAQAEASLHTWHILLPLGSVVLGLFLIFYTLRARTQVNRRWTIRLQWPILGFRGFIDWFLLLVGLILTTLIPVWVLLSSNQDFLHVNTPPTKLHEVMHRVNQSLTVMIAVAVTVASIAVITGALRGFPTRAGRFWIGAGVGVILIAGSVLAPSIEQGELVKAVTAAFLTVALVMFLWVEGHIEDIKAHIYGMSKVSRAMSVLKNPDLKEEIGRLVDGIGNMLEGARAAVGRLAPPQAPGTVEISANDREMMAFAAIRDCADSVDRLRDDNEVTIKKDAFTRTWDRLIETFDSYLSVCDLSMYNALSREAATRTGVEWKARIRREKAQIIDSMAKLGAPASLDEPQFDKLILYEPLSRSDLGARADIEAPCLSKEERCCVKTCTTSYPCVVRSVVEAWLTNTEEEIDNRKRRKNGEEATIFSSTRSHFFPEEAKKILEDPTKKKFSQVVGEEQVTTRFWMMEKGKFRITKQSQEDEGSAPDVFRGLDNSDIGVFGRKFVGEELKFRTSAGDNGWQYNIRLNNQLAENVHDYVKAKIIASGWPLLSDPPSPDPTKKRSWFGARD